MQVIQNNAGKLGVFNRIHIFKSAAFNGIGSLKEDRGISLKAYCFTIAIRNGKDRASLLIQGRLHAVAENDTDFLPYLGNGVLGVYVHHNHLSVHCIFRYRIDAQQQAQGKDRISPGSSIVCSNIGNCLGICRKQFRVGRHILAQHILRRNDVHEALLLRDGSKIAPCLKQIVSIIFNRNKGIVTDLLITHIEGSLEAPVKGLLIGRTLCIVHQIIVILLGNPMRIPHREHISAIPHRLLYLMF